MNTRAAIPGEPRAVTEARRRLAAIARTTAILAAELADLHSLAFEPAVGQERPRGRAKPTEGAIIDDPERETPAPAHGDRVGEFAAVKPMARRVWHDLVDELQRVDKQLETMRARAQNLAAGPGAMSDLRGTLIAPAEFAAAQEAQRRRQGRGEWSPYRTEVQPRHPLAVGRPKRRKRK